MFPGSDLWGIHDAIAGSTRSRRQLILMRVTLRSKSRFVAIIAILVFGMLRSSGQRFTWSERMADAVLLRPAEGREAAQWDEGTGSVLGGMDAAWYNTANGDYFRYVKRIVDVESHLTLQ